MKAGGPPAINGRRASEFFPPAPERTEKHPAGDIQRGIRNNRYYDGNDPENDKKERRQATGSSDWRDEQWVLGYGLYVNTAWWLMGFQAGLRSFTAAVLGGIGNVTGAMLGGFMIGILTSLSDGLLNPAWTRAWVFAVLVLVLIFRPNGLLGSAIGQKA